MPRQVDIGIFNTGRTMVDRKEVRRWLDYLGVSDFDIPGPEEMSDPALLVALEAKRCYMSFQPGLNPNVTKVRSDYVEYLENVIRSRHGSVLEHAYYTFNIEGVSRVFTAEMNRHRAGWAISEGSMRFIRYDTIPYWLPTSLVDAPGDDADLLDRKARSRDLFDRQFRLMEAGQAEWNAIWEMDGGSRNFSYKKAVTSAGRRLIGMGVATGGGWSGNIRAVRHVLASRSAPEAEEEIFHVFSRVGDYMIEREPMLFGDFRRTEGGGWVPEFWKV